MPVLLDLFSGAGGAAVGYRKAGWEVFGIDIVEQPNYPFNFCRMDAIEMLKDILRHGNYGFDVIHASPPCQPYSKMSACRPGLSDTYIDYVATVRGLLKATGLPYVIENVPGAPLHDPIELCGTMFGRELYKHRLFESNVKLAAPPHPPHVKPASRAGHWRPGTIICVAGHMAPMKLAREVMGGVDWMTREELAESIPWFYTEWIGWQLHSTQTLIGKYHSDDGDPDEEMAVLEELHRRAMNGDRAAARAVLNDHDVDDPGWTPQTGSETRN